jgi:3-hydroxyacyl-[acyl-carrier-protein] dehydratase
VRPKDYKISDLIPQQSPMIMIDELIDSNDISAKGRLFITGSNLFVSNGYFCEPGLVEFIAQTAAAFTGYKSKSVNEKVSEGYIGAIKNLVIYSLPPANAEIQSEIKVDNEIVGYTIIIGKVLYKSKVIAECEMRILEK